MNDFISKLTELLFVNAIIYEYSTSKNAELAVIFRDFFYRMI
jgi:hypothetical protein